MLVHLCGAVVVDCVSCIMLVRLHGAVVIDCVSCCAGRRASAPTWCCCCRLCVVLLTKKIAEHDAHRDSFREFAVEHSNLSDRVRFAYVYEDSQSPFVKSVTWGRGAVNDTPGSPLKVTF